MFWIMKTNVSVYFPDTRFSRDVFRVTVYTAGSVTRENLQHGQSNYSNIVL